MRRGKGFTLIELMIVVAIIGILAAVAIPKFGELVRKAQDGQVKGNLGMMRSALTIYYGDMEGNFPSDLNSLTIGGRYLGYIPTLKVQEHTATTVIRHNENTNPFGCGGGYMLDSGEWIFWSDPGSGGSLCEGSPAPAGQRARVLGELWIACTHTDSKGSVWTSY